MKKKNFLGGRYKICEYPKPHFSFYWSIVDLQCYLNFKYTTQWFDIKIHYIMLLLLSCVWLFATLWTAACQASLSFTVSWSLLRLMSIESVMPSNHLILCCLFLLLPSVFPSIKFFFNDSFLCIRCPKYWGFSFGISPSNECSGFISFRIDWFDLLA